ncbi:hypothetical protein GCM10027289_11180 [Tsukamurella serpentis]
MTAHSVAGLRTLYGTEVPPVLWSPPDPRRDAAPVAAPEDLSDDETTALRVLAAPDVRIEGRCTDAMESKLCLARSGPHTARVVRSAGTATVDLPHCDGSADRLFTLVEPLLPKAVPAPPEVAASFPAGPGRAALAEGEPGVVAARLRGLGVDGDAARSIAKVFGRSRRSAEFTVYAGHRRSTVVAVIDASAGRIVALTTVDAGGEWISIAEGSAHRIGRALRRACEGLPGGGWTP